MQSDRPVVRTILAVNEADQSLTFAGDVPQGHFARLMRANFDRLVDGATAAAKPHLFIGLPISGGLTNTWRHMESV